MLVNYDLHASNLMAKQITLVAVSNSSHGKYVGAILIWELSGSFLYGYALPAAVSLTPISWHFATTSLALPGTYKEIKYPPVGLFKVAIPFNS